MPHTNKETPLNNFDERISHFVSIYKRKLIVDNLDEIYELFNSSWWFIPVKTKSVNIYVKKNSIKISRFLSI